MISFSWVPPDFIAVGKKHKTDLKWDMWIYWHSFSWKPNHIWFSLYQFSPVASESSIRVIPAGQQIIQQSTGKGFECWPGLNMDCISWPFLPFSGHHGLHKHPTWTVPTGAENWSLVFSISCFWSPFQQGIHTGKGDGELSETAAAGMYSPVHSRQLLN